MTVMLFVRQCLFSIRFRRYLLLIKLEFVKMCRSCGRRSSNNRAQM